MGFFGKIFNGLKKTKDAIASIFVRNFDDEFYEELENALISSDMGARLAMQIVEELKDEIKLQKCKEPEQAKQILRRILSDYIDNQELEFDYPICIIIVGVNGVGKTTTIGKLANLFLRKKKTVTLCAADTFRAAASEQLAVWAKRANVKIVKHGEGADPSAVVFDAITSAKSQKSDVLIIDTAGRLHNKTNLMEELKKIVRIVEKNYSEASLLNFLILDATTGQNGINQAKAFDEAVNLDGIILTKLDGTSKGGVVFAINNELELPICFVGVGEKIDDLVEFDAEEFVEGIV